MLRDSRSEKADSRKDSHLVAEIIQSVLAKQLDEIESKLEGTLKGEDPEELHKMRVATRRSRAALSLFKQFCPADWYPIREELRWLGSELGAVRDLEVQIEKFQAIAASGAAPAREVAECVAALSENLHQTRGALGGTLGSPRFRELIDSWRRAFTSGFGGSVPGSLPATLVAPELMRSRKRRAERLGAATHGSSSDEKLHELRIAAKRFRYAAEFFEEVYGKEAKVLARQAARLQDILGAHQDDVVALGWLGSLDPDGRLEATRNALEADRLARRSEFPSALDALLGEAWRPMRRKMNRELRRAWRLLL